MQMVKVSVILPIYNVAPYLAVAFDSILHQTLKDMKSILYRAMKLRTAPS